MIIVVLQGVGLAGVVSVFLWKLLKGKGNKLNANPLMSKEIARWGKGKRNVKAGKKKNCVLKSTSDVPFEKQDYICVYTKMHLILAIKQIVSNPFL